MHQRARHPRPRRSQRVSQRNRSSVRIHFTLLPRLHQSQLSQTINDLARKRLVNLPPVDVLLLQSQPVQQFRDRQRRPNAHLVGIAPHRRRADKLSHDPPAQAELRGGAPAHQQRRRRAVGDLARVARGALAVGLERRLQLRQRLGRDARADAVVASNSDLLLLAHGIALLVHLLKTCRNGNNLRVEPPGISRPRRPNVRFRSDLVLNPAIHAVPLRNVLRREAHRHDAVPHMLRLRMPQRRPNVHRHGLAPVIPRHALHARPNTNIHHPILNLRRDQRNALQRRRTRAVRREQARAVRIASVVERHAAGLGAAQLGQHDAHADIVDQRRVHLGHGEAGGLEDGGEQLLRVGVLEVALGGAAYGRAEGGEDDDVGGCFGEHGGEAFGRHDAGCCLFFVMDGPLNSVAHSVTYSLRGYI
ncbi:hypothetical protein CFAM422_008114 [Trichoderma lentiforme]|uniref:Uncharacterized protein n=1 Tax=Trichoderma lentiforme TaxID=1567552 RepID=A0A9P4XAJ2_9HYPO|nr:hypothetical protein CFAM422_008114 [Trichoderma lentiforme]